MNTNTSKHGMTPTSAADHSDLLHTELILSHLLRWGVFASLVIMLLGITLTFIHHPDYLSNHDQLTPLTHPVTAPADSLSGTFHLLRYSEGRGVVVLGLLLLILTPVLRVAASAIIFTLQRNRAFVLLTLLVLITLIVSFFLGKVE